MADDKLITFRIPMGYMSENCWLIADAATGSGAVIDPGGKESAEKIAQIAASNRITISKILLTHAHFDHMLSLESLRKLTSAPLFVHQYDSAGLENPRISYMAQYGGANSPCAPAESLISDGDEIQLGELTLKVIHTPGHTPGSVCYMVCDQIFTGDTLFRENIGRCDLFGGDEEAIKQSLLKLKMISGDYTIHPGHGEDSTLEHERNNNIYLRNL